MIFTAALCLFTSVLGCELYLARQSNKRLLAMITETRNLCVAIYNASDDAKTDADLAETFGLTDQQFADLEKNNGAFYGTLTA